MKLYLRTIGFIAISLFCLLPLQSVADHAVGAEISYKCTSTPGVFEITYVFYRACTGIPVCGGICGAACTRTLQLMGADPSCNATTFGSITLSLVSVRDADMNPQCPNTKSICNNMGCVSPGTYTPGIERYEFKGFANIGPSSGIPPSCCNVRFVFSECCRNAEINTGSSWQNFYVDAVVNRCLSVSPCNNSPEFKNDSYTAICGGEPLIFNYGATDIDGDSLSFAFAPALQGFNSSVTYTPPFAFDKPMPWIGSATSTFPGGIHCDPVSGDIMFTPPNGGSGFFYGVVVIEVKQWKKINGIPTVIGITRRDVQMTIRGDCAPNNSPRFMTLPSDTGNVNIPKTKWTVCEGEQLCFTVTGKDTDVNLPAVSDTTILSWDSVMATYGATFLPTYNPANRSTTGPREDSYQFCWTPGPGSGRGSFAPYLFTISVKDNKCPNPGKTIRGFSITVLKKPDAGIVKTNKQCGKWQVGYTKTDPSQVFDSTCFQIAKQPSDYTFTNGSTIYPNVTSTPQILFSQPGKYLIKFIARSGSCLNTVFDTLVVDTALSIITRDTLTCQGNTLTISAVAKYGVPTYVYKWYNSIRDTATPPLNAPNFSQPALAITPNTPRHYTIQVRDLNGCIAYDSVKVALVNAVQEAIVTPVKCFGGNTGSITVIVSNPTPMHQYKLDSGVFQSSNTFNNLTAGIHTVTVKDTSSCISTQTLTVKQPALLKDTLTTVTAQTCIGLTNGSISTIVKGGTAPYKYSIDSILFDTIHSFTNLAPGTYKIHILDSSLCYTSVTRTVLPADTIRYTTTVKPLLCSGNTNGEIKISATGGKKPFTYKLGTGAFVSDSVFKNLAANTYTFTIKDANSCTVSLTDSIKSITPLQQTSVTKNPNCFAGNNGSIVITATGGTAPYMYRKAITGLYDTTSQFNNLTSGTYSMSIKDNNNCVLNFSRSLVQPQSIGTNITMQPTSCFENNDGILSVSASGGIPPYLYSLDSSAFGSSNTFANVVGGTRLVIVRDSLLCEKTFNKIVTRAPKVDVGVAQKNSSCFNRADGSITITPLVGKSPFMYNINGGAFSSASVFTNLIANNYKVIIKDSLGCLDTSSIVITQPAQIIAGSITGPATSNLHQVDTYAVAAQAGLNYLWLSQKGVFTTLPTSATVAVRWDSTGVGMVAAYVYDDLTCGDTTTMAVTIGSVGLSELSQSWGLNVYPNPAKNMLNIQLQKLPEQNQIQLYDVQGKLVLQQELKLTQQLNIETLVPGMYLLKIGAWSGQVIKE